MLEIGEHNGDEFEDINDNSEDNGDEFEDINDDSEDNGDDNGSDTCIDYSESSTMNWYCSKM